MDERVIFLIIGLILTITFLIFFILKKYLEMISIRNELKTEKANVFRIVKITSFSYNHEKASKFSIGIYPIKSDVIFTQTAMFFLPQKFSLFLALTEMPRKFNKNLDEFIMVNHNSNELTFKFENKEAFLKRKIIEISVKGNYEILGEINNYFADWRKK